MSYSFGVSMHYHIPPFSGHARSSVFGATAGAAQQCAGLEVSDDGLGNMGDECCSSKTWNNSTYKSVKGATSFQHWNEKRIVHGLNKLLRPVSGFPNAAEAQAYDESLLDPVIVQPGFIDKLNNAFLLYLKLFPPRRWYNRKNAKKGKYDDGECGPYSAWRSKRVAVTSDIAQALRSLSGTNITDAQLKEIEWDAPFDPNLKSSASALRGQQSLWEGIPQAFYTWAKQVDNHIKTVPGSRGNDNILTMPGYTKFIQRNGNQIGPTDWTVHFMQLFSPKVSSGPPRAGAHVPTLNVGGKVIRPQLITKATGALRPMQPSISAAVASKVTLASMGEEERGDRASGKAVSPMLVLGSIALLGLGTYYFMSR